MHPLIFHPVELAIKDRPISAFRDPQPDPWHYADDWYYGQKAVLEVQSSDADWRTTQDEAQFIVSISNPIRGLFRRWRVMYAVGEPLDKLLVQMRADWPLLVALRDFAKRRCEKLGVTDWDMYGVDAWHIRYGLWLWLLLEDDVARVRAVLPLCCPSAQQPRFHREQFAVLDALYDAFLPDGLPPPAQHDKPYWGGWNQLAQALGGERAQQQAGIERYMARWNQMMKPLGWKAQRRYPLRDAQGLVIEQACTYPGTFMHFATEAALAVCALDLDDSEFCDHPYYPKDLVEHYRAHVRMPRDGWRAQGAALRRPVPVPPPPRKITLHSSKSKGVKRWLELVSDGNCDTVEQALQEQGRVRSLKTQLWTALGALREGNAAACADIKDDTELESQIDAMLEERGLAGFDASGLPGAGVQRCEALMQTLEAWLSTKPYALLQPPQDADAWVGWLVAREHLNEYLSISLAIGVRHKSHM